MAAVVNLGRQLVTASKEGTIEQVGALLDQGVAVDSRAIGYTGLMEASYRGRRAIVVLLLDRGADVNAASNEGSGHTSMLLASEEGHLDVVEVLHARGANLHHVDTYGQSALFGAAYYDRLSVCEFLLSKGADLMAAMNDGRTALGRYGTGVNRRNAEPLLSLATLALRRAALEAAWAAGPHPSQVQRRRDECWARRGPVLWVLAEHAYRPLQLRAQVIAAAALGAPLPVVPYSPKEDVLRSEGLVRYIVAFL